MKIIPIFILSTILFSNVFSVDVELNVDGNANFVAENNEEDHKNDENYGSEKKDEEDYYEDEFEYYDDKELDLEEDIYEDKDPYEDIPFEGEYADDNYDDDATTNEDYESVNDIIVHNKFNSNVFLYFSPENSFMVLSFNTCI